MAREKKKNEEKRRKKRSHREREREREKEKRKCFFNERRERSLIKKKLASCGSAWPLMVVHCSKKLKNFTYGTTIVACILNISGSKNSNIAI